MSSAVTGKGVPVKVPSRSSRLSVLRFVRMAVAFVVVAGSLGLATVAATAQSSGGSCPSDGAAAYSDVPESSFAYDDSRCLRELGISDAGDTYRPGDDMTRSEMAAFMANAYAALTGMEAPIEDHMFTDVAGDPNADDIARISPNGLMITTGTSDTTYSPDNPVVRGHMALFLTRLYKAVTGSDAPAGTTPFTDIGDRPAGEQAAIGAIYALGVTTGTTDTTYSPHGNVTREQMASFVARMYRAIDAQAPALDAPGGVSASPSGTAGTALEVSWDAVEGATSYVVQWGTDYANQRTTSDTSTTIHGLTKGTAVSVRVAAVNADGQSDWASASGTPGTTPGAVGNLRAAPGASPGTINVTWTKPADDGGTPLTGYLVQWAKGNNAQESTRVNNPGATSHTISGLDSAALYFVWVTAVNGAGDGAASNAATATPTGNVPSGIVKISLPGVADAGGRFASLTWPTVTPNARLGQSLDDYTIHRKCGSQLWPDQIVPNADARIVAAHVNVATQANQVLPVGSALLGGALDPANRGTLVNGVECTYRVRANVYVDANGDSDQNPNEPSLGKWVEGTATPMATTAPAPGPAATVVPAAPAAASAVRGNRTVQVNWTLVPASGQGTGGPITGYRITLLSPAPVPVASVTVSATTESHTFTGLTNGWAYSGSVVALNSRGAGAAAPVAAVTPGAAPGAPTNVRVTQGTARGTSLKVAWNAPASNSLAEVTGYTLQRRTSATATAPAAGWTDATPVQPAGTATMVEDTGLAPGTSYDYRVQATTTTTDATASPWSAAASGSATGRPGAVTSANIEVTANAGSLTLAWTPADGNGSKVTSYTLRYRRDGAAPNEYNPWNSAGSVAASLLPTKTITGLANNQAYEIQIFTHNAQGSSTTPGSATGTPAAGNGSAAAPTSIKATVVPVTTDANSNNGADDITTGANSRINVSWNAVPRATAYVVEFLQVLDATGGSPGNPVGNWSTTGVTVTAATASAAITGLTPNATYVVRVRASAPAAVASIYGFATAAKAERAPTTSPTGVSVVQIAGTSTLRVDWLSLNATNTRTQKVTSYKVSWAPTNAQVTGNRGTATIAGPANAGSGMPMSYNITGLTAIGTPMRVTVQAVNNIGAGAGGAETFPPS